jgi:hypothetical protein
MDEVGDFRKEVAGHQMVPSAVQQNMNPGLIPPSANFVWQVPIGLIVPVKGI